MTREEILESYELKLDTVERFRKMGMISPKRIEDGALVYSHENGEMLQRLLLLEKMGFSEDDFFKLKSGDKTLKALIERQLGRLEEGCLGKEISRQILEEGADFQSFDAKKYLRQLDDDALENIFRLNSSYGNQVFCPWRRFFARMFDSFIYHVVWYTVLGFLFYVKIQDRDGYLWIIDVVVVETLIMLFIEPFLLNRFGTTFGKWIFGLKVKKADGTRLSYAEGLKRTLGVIGKGLGYNVTFYNLVRLYKSYKLCKAEEIQPWDEGISYTIRDKKWYRWVVYIVLIVIVSILFLLIESAQHLPPNRGDITLAEFAENYNYYCEFYDMNDSWYMDENGQLVGKRLKKNSSSDTLYDEDMNIKVNSDGTIYYYVPIEECPSFEYEIEDGYLKSIFYSYEADIEENMTYESYRETGIIAFAFGYADRAVGLISKNNISSIPMRIAPYDDYYFKVGKTSYACDVEWGSYEGDIDFVPKDGGETVYYKMKFFITKE